MYTFGEAGREGERGGKHEADGDSFSDGGVGNGPGDDNVQVRDFPAVKDVVYCGGGRDTAYVDRLDVVHRCEIARLP